MLSTKYKVAKFITYALAAVFLCVLQNTPGLFVIRNIKPMWAAAFAICVTLFEKETAGGLFGAFAGLLCDFFSSYTFGFYALGLFFFCVVVGLLTQGYMRPVAVNGMLFTLVSMGLIQWAGFFFTIYIWGTPDAGLYYLTRLLPMCVYTALTALLLFYPTRAIHRYWEQRIAAA